MMLRLTPVMLCLFLACQSIQNNLISPTQREGLEAVSAVFGSTVTFKWSFSTSSSRADDHYDEVRIDSFDARLEPYRTHPFMLASNAAVLYYRCLTDREKEQTHAVHTILPFQTQGIDTYMFRTTLLDTMIAKIILADTLVTYLQSRDFDKMFSKLRTVSQKNRKIFIGDYEDIEKQYGKPNALVPLGFQFYDVGDSTLMGRFFGLLKMSQGTMLQFSLDFDPDIASDRVYSLQFKHKF